MTEETKFDVGQLVWYIDNNKISKGTVYKISIMRFRDSQHETYSVIQSSGLVDRQSNTLFGSKEELIASIE